MCLYSRRLATIQEAAPDKEAQTVYRVKPWRFFGASSKFLQRQHKVSRGHCRREKTFYAFERVCTSMLSVAWDSAFVCTRCTIRQLSRKSGVKGARRIARRYITYAAEDTGSERQQEHSTSAKEKGQHELLHRISGRPIRHRRAKLGVESLGKPAEIIIVDEDDKPRFFKDFPLEDSNSGKTPINEVLKEAVRNSDPNLKPEEIKANIEHFRTFFKSDDRRVTFSQKQDIAQKLSDAFSKRQLYEYIATWLNNTEKSGEDAQGESKKPSFALKIYDITPSSSKWKLTTTILSNLWKLQVYGERRTIEMEVDQRKSGLIDYLNEDLKKNLQLASAQVELVGHRKRVRLTGAGSAIDSLQSQLVDFLSTAEVTKVESPRSLLARQQLLLFKKQLGTQLSDYIGHRHGVFVRRDPHASGLVWTIASHPGNDRAVKKAIRDLHLSVQDPIYMKKANLWTIPGSWDAQAIDVQVEASNNETYPISIKWQRWAGSTLKVPTPSIGSIFSKLERLAKSSKKGRKFDLSLLKYKGLTASLTATYGQVLFQGYMYMTKGSSKQEATKRPALLSQVPRHIVLGKEYPRLPQTLATLPFQERSKHIEIILSPTPQLDGSHLQLPNIRLTLPASTEKSPAKPHIMTAQVILDKRTYVLLLPHTPLDIHFEIDLCYDLLVSDSEVDKAFLMAIQDELFSNITSFRDLPGLIELQLPDTLDKLQRPQRKDTIQSTTDPSLQEHPLSSRSVSYMVKSSLEVEELRFVYNGFPLVYSHSSDLIFPRS